MNRLSALLLATISLSACFSERLPPPTFRHSCSGDGECIDGESCVSGLCQIACTVATANEDCQLGQGSFVACINGVCSGTCDLADDTCPGAQSCTEVPVLSEQIGAGVCIEACSEMSCPEGEVCVEGFCATACDEAVPDACGDGQTCLVGVCVPAEIEPGSSDDTSTATDGDTE